MSNTNNNATGDRVFIGLTPNRLTAVFGTVAEGANREEVRHSMSAAFKHGAHMRTGLVTIPVEKLSEVEEKISSEMIKQEIKAASRAVKGFNFSKN